MKSRKFSCSGLLRSTERSEQTLLSLLDLWVRSLRTTVYRGKTDRTIVDVINIERTNENFRLIYDTKGRFAVHRITPEEAKVIILGDIDDTASVFGKA